MAALGVTLKTGTGTGERPAVTAPAPELQGPAAHRPDTQY
jgi:hypothetical protein